MDALLGIEGQSIGETKTIDINEARKGIIEARKYSKYSLLLKIKEPEINKRQD